MVCSPHFIRSFYLLHNWDVLDSIAVSTSKIKEWPFLFIRIEKVKEVSTRGYIESDISNFAICGHEIELIENRNLLVISSCMGGDVEITFLGEVTFL